MKALTIWQPWASLIAYGAKPYEFRGWKPPRSLIGQRIVIHAAKRTTDWYECRRLHLDLEHGGDRAAETCLHRDIALPLLAGKLYQFPIACGLGTARLGEPRNGIDIARDFGVTRANDSDRDEHANWGWPMLDVERWDEPIPMRGRQGIWDWPTPESACL